MGWYLKKYGVDLGKKAKGGAKVDKGKEKDMDEEKKSRHVIFKLKAREAKQKLDPAVEEQFQSGRLLACISSRPGQCGRCDGYVLEGEELTFYKRKLEKKKKAWEASARAETRRGGGSSHVQGSPLAQ